MASVACASVSGLLSAPEADETAKSSARPMNIILKLFIFHYLAMNTHPLMIRNTPIHRVAGMFSWKMNMAASIPNT